MSASSWSRKRIRSQRLRVLDDIASTSPWCTFNAANRHWVPLRLYSCSRLAGLPAWGGRSGLTGALAWIPVFSSIETTSTFSGGSTYSPQTSPIRSSNPFPREVRHDPIVRAVRLDLRTLQNHVGLGLRHPDLLAQLPVSPALPPLTRLLRLRTRARLGDQKRPGLRTVRQRPSRPPRIAQPGHPTTRIPRTPLLHRPLPAPHPLSDLRRAQPLTRRQHDPCPLHHPHLRARRAHDPLKLHTVLVADLDPLAHTLRSHHQPPSSPNKSTRSSRPTAPNPYLGSNLQEPPLAC